MTVDTSGLTSEQARLAVLYVIAERDAALLARQADRLRALADAAIGEERRAATVRDLARLRFARAVPDWRTRLMEKRS